MKNNEIIMLCTELNFDLLEKYVDDERRELQERCIRSDVPDDERRALSGAHEEYHKFVNKLKDRYDDALAELKVENKD